MSEKWRPISEYPENKPMVDLWVKHNEHGATMRVTDFYCPGPIVGWVSARLNALPLSRMHPGYHPTHFMETPAPPEETDR